MSLLTELVEQRDAASTELDEITSAVESRAEGEQTLTDDEEARSTELIATIDELDERLEEENRNVKRARTLAEARQRALPPALSGAQVEDEPMVYGEGSPNSWIADTIWVQTRSPFDPRRQAAEQRLGLWGHQVEREVADNSKEGKYAAKQLREVYRELNNPEQERVAMAEIRERGRIALEMKENRAVGTGGGATASASGGGGAALVSPFIFMGDVAPYREFGRAFVDQCNNQTLPDYGMNVYIPHITGPAGIAQQTEGSGINETDPTAGYITAALITEAGEVTVSQQLLDRSGPNFSYDRMVFDQLNRDYAPKIDTYVLTQALSGATTQNWSGNSNAFILVATSGSGGFQGQVSKAKASIRTTAGTVLNPTHLFMHADRWEYIAAWSDANGRPVVVPDYAGPYNAVAAGSSDGDVGIEGRTGYRFNGLPAFTDQNIPLNGTTTQDQAIVADLSEVYVWEGTPVTRVVPQTLASNLQVLLQMYSYVTAVPRYAAGVVAITGTGMGTITYTT